MSEQIEPSDECETAEIPNVWFHLRRGDPQPAIDLCRMLERNGCTAAAEGFLKDLAKRIEETSDRVGSENAANAGRFVETAKSALNECLGNDPDMLARYMRAALRIRTPRIRVPYRFRLAHMFLLTAGCAAAVSFVGNLTAIAVIYCCVLVLVLPLYAGSLYRAQCGYARSAKNALLTSVTILLVFLFAMTRADIRDFYPLPFWSIPPALVFAAAYVDRVEKRRLFSPPVRRNASASQ